jgi:AcrR family transcriptional regulator
MGAMSLRKGKKPTASPPARPLERINRTAYELFTRHGIRAVGVDTIVARSSVAKMTLYRHYPSKDQLALAFLHQRCEQFLGELQQGVGRPGLPAPAALLAVFDVLDKWYRSPDYAGCPVVKAVLEFDEPNDLVRGGALRHFATVRGFLRKLADEAGAPDPDILARQWQLLVFGSIIAAVADDPEAAQRAKELGSALLARQGVAPTSRKPQRRKADR